MTGLDSSASYSFSQIKDAADETGTRLVLTSLSPELLSSAWRTMPDSRLQETRTPDMNTEPARTGKPN